ncbi:hypothetical protein B0H14DRAFT_2562951 [Mycena olivaceomarginata]|nr:hypothetical protein B0H14DRAFT_2562951 [Mycena olivaceomarginata]
MDAPMGTSTDGDRLDIGLSASISDDMGHSAKTHLSMQDDADETGHRSRSADVGIKRATMRLTLAPVDQPSRTSPSNPCTTTPRRKLPSTTRVPTSRLCCTQEVLSRFQRSWFFAGMKSSPRYFDDRFLNNGGVDDPLEDGGASVPYDWPTLLRRTGWVISPYLD